MDVAIVKLIENAKEHNVVHCINGIKNSIEDFEIVEQSYDLIMAISALEHIDTEKSFLRKLNEIKNGLRDKGIACFVINTDVREIDLDTNKTLEAQFEVNLSTEKLQKYLNDVFCDFVLLKSTVVNQEYDVPRENFVSRLHTNVVTYVVRKR